MSRSKIIWIIVLMSISIVGICGLEYYWMSTAIEEKAEEFDRAANRALYATVDYLEKSEAEILIIEQFGQAIPEFDLSFAQVDSAYKVEIEDLRLTEPENTTSYTFNTKVWVEEEEIEAPNIFEEAEEDIITVYSDDGKLLRKEVILNQGDEASSFIYIATDSAAPLVARTKTVNRRFNVYKDALEEVIIKGIQTKPDFKTRLGDENIDSLLHMNLLTEGIDIEFDWAVFDDSSKVVMNKEDEIGIQEAALFNFSVPVFPDFPDEMTLSLRFPAKEIFVLKSLGGMLGLVFLFSVFMILTFGVTLSMILRQKKLSEVKSDFINNMTHEFKTPLATIGLALDSIRHPNVSSNPTEVNRFMGIIDEENKRLTGHVEKILQLAKMEKGQLVIHKKVSELNEIVEDVIHAFELKLSSTNASLDLELGDNLGTAQLDENHIFNVIANLLDNAIKYSKGSPKIKIHTSRNKNHLILKVSDAGIGLSADDQRKVFKTFYRAQKGDIHNVKGFGLGLSYSNEVVQLHGGEMTLSSTLGKGSTFGFKLPV